VTRAEFGLLGASCVLALAGCSPQLAEFSAQPRPVCPGSSTSVRWRFSNAFLASATLTSDLPGAQPIAVPDSGAMRLAVPRTMTVSVNARRLFWHSSPNRLEIRVLPPDTTALVPFRVRSVDGDSLVTSDSLTWDPHYRIQSIANITGWPVRLTHDAMTVVLADSTPTEVFMGRSGGGLWETRLPTAMPGATRHPSAVQLRVRFTCDTASANP
jgi:hypothetical protein